MILSYSQISILIRYRYDTFLQKSRNFDTDTIVSKGSAVTYLQLSGHKVFQGKGANSLSFEATILTDKFSKEEENGIESFPQDKVYLMNAGDLVMLSIIIKLWQKICICITFIYVLRATQCTHLCVWQKITSVARVIILSTDFCQAFQQ